MLLRMTSGGIMLISEHNSRLWVKIERLDWSGSIGIVTSKQTYVKKKGTLNPHLTPTKEFQFYRKSAHGTYWVSQQVLDHFWVFLEPIGVRLKVILENKLNIYHH